MKNKKWLNYTLGILLTLVVLTVVAGAGIRVGMMQSASFTHPAFARDFDRAPQVMQGNPQNNGGVQPAQGNSTDNGRPQTMQGNFRESGGPQMMQGDSRNNQGFDNRSGERRDGGFSFLSPIFGLIRLAVLALLAWIGYKFVKKSGWRLSLAKTSPAPVAMETPSAAVEEKK